jgi:hypothetical protein
MTGPPYVLARAVPDLITNQSNIGIEVNTSKTKVLLARRGNLEHAKCWRTTYASILDMKLKTGIQENILIHPLDWEQGTNQNASYFEQDYGMPLLGSSVGTDSYRKKWLKGKLEQTIAKLETHKLIPKMQDAWLVLLRSTNALPNFVLRTLPPAITDEYAENFYQLLKRKVEEMVGSPLSDTQALKAFLPISEGGIGLNDTRDTAPAAYLASSLYFLQQADTDAALYPSNQPIRNSQWHQNVMEVLKNRNETIFGPEASSLEENLELLIEELMCLRHTEHQGKLLADALAVKRRRLEMSLSDPAEKVILQATSSFDSGRFLESASFIFNQSMSDREFRYGLRSRLGLPIITQDEQYVCTCPRKTKLNPRADHVRSCKELGMEDTTRHHALVDITARMLTTARYNPRIEPKDISLPGRNGQNIIPDIYTDAKEGDVSASVYDVVVPEPLSDSHMYSSTENNSILIPGYAGRKAYERKERHYSLVPQLLGYRVTPIAIESYGKIEDRSKASLNAIIKRIADLQYKEFAIVQRYWLTLVSVTLQKENFRLCTSRIEKLEKKRKPKSSMPYNRAYGLTFFSN